MTSKAKILYVDDEPINIVNFTMSFENEFEIVSAESGKEALEIFRSQRPVIVVSDQRMPGMTGVELLTQIYKEDPEPVRIIMTAYSDFDDIKEAINKGHIYQFCQKPWNMSELRNVLLRAAEKYTLSTHNKFLLSELGQKNKLLSASNIQLKDKIKSNEKLEKRRRKDETMMQAQAKLASLGKISSSIAHEINQPLTYLNVMLEATSKDIQNDILDIKELQEDTKEARHQIYRITQIIRHLQTFGRTNTGEFSKISVSDTLESSLLLLKKNLQTNTIKLQADKPPHLPSIYGDSIQMEQMFINLIQNSIDALQNKDERRISVVFSHNKKTVNIIYSDNGAGMSAETAEMIFEPFFTTKEVGKGTGLGMSIVHGIINTHGGKIKCESTQGSGTTFTISLPIYNDNCDEGKE